MLSKDFWAKSFKWVAVQERKLVFCAHRYVSAYVYIMNNMVS